MQSELMQRIEKEARAFFPRQGHHGFDHVLRVRELALRIGRKEKADLEVVEAAALLHDIAREREDRGEIECHAAVAAEEVEKLLLQAGFPKEKIEKVRHCIAVHRASKRLKPESIEAKILQDADRLDVVGAIGIGRYFHRAGALGLEIYDPGLRTDVEYKGQQMPAINHLIVKCLNVLSPESFNTKAARAIAEKRHSFLREFIEQFLAEWEGKV